MVIVKSGMPTEEQLAAAWQEMMTQYNEAKGDSDNRRYFALHKQLFQHKISLSSVNIAIEMLKSPERLTRKGIAHFEKFLNETFYTVVELDPTEQEDYFDQLTIWKNQSASIRFQIALKQAEYDAIGEKMKAQGEKPTLAYYQTQLLNLSDYAGYPLTDNISTYEFCQRCNRLDKFLEKQK